jgi:hypothetical protein
MGIYRNREGIMEKLEGPRYNFSGSINITVDVANGDATVTTNVKDLSREQCVTALLEAVKQVHPEYRRMSEKLVNQADLRAVKDNVLTIVAEHISPENAVTLMMTAVEEIATTELSRITGTTREEVLAMVDKEIEDAENHS